MPAFEVIASTAFKCERVHEIVKGERGDVVVEPMDRRSI
jgi:hypothetical protein